MSVGSVITDNVRKGLVWVLVGGVTAAGATIISSSRQQAVQAQEIASVRHSERSLAVQVRSLRLAVGELNVSVAVLNQELVDRAAARAKRETDHGIRN